MKSDIKTSLFSLLALLMATFVCIYITNRYVLTLSFYEISGGSVAATADQQGRIYESIQHWIYISSAVYLAVKVFLITLILYSALFVSGSPVPFARIFVVVVWSEFIFFVPAMIKIAYFYYGYPGATLPDWHRFYVLSALSLFPAAPADWSYALQTLNVFEVLYWLALAAGISRYSTLNFDRSLQLVLVSYLPALISWVALITLSALVMFPGTG